MKQANVSTWMKGITYAIGLAGIFFFAIVMPYMCKQYFAENEQVAFLFVPVLVFWTITAIFCYVVLFFFYQVCLQIEKDNSFSKENVKAFSIMSKLLIILAIVWIAFLLVHVIGGFLTFEVLWKMLLFIFAWLAIAGLCRALSLLIEKAMEIKEENELTI